MAQCDYSFQSFKKTLGAALDSVDVEIIRKLYNKSRSIIELTETMLKWEMKYGKVIKAIVVLQTLRNHRL